MQVELVNDGPVTILVDSTTTVLSVARVDPSLARSSVLACVVLPAGASLAQQRPLVTEDPGDDRRRPRAGRGRLRLRARASSIPASGLEGHLLRVAARRRQRRHQLDRRDADRRRPLQPPVDHRPQPAAPLAGHGRPPPATRRRASRTWSSAPRSASLPKRPGRPSFGFRFATKLPNASNESGLGLDTTDFYASVLVGKTVQSVRVVGNVGLGILGDPDARRSAERRADLRRVVRARADQGRRGGRRGQRPARHARRRAAAGHRVAGRGPLGARYTIGGWRGDAAVLFGLTVARPGHRLRRPGSPTCSTPSRCRE